MASGATKNDTSEYKGCFLERMTFMVQSVANDGKQRTKFKSDYAGLIFVDPNSYRWILPSKLIFLPKLLPVIRKVSAVHI